MRNWQITSFIRNNGTIYTRTHDETNIYGAGTQRMTGMQFMCNADFRINSITRAAGTNTDPAWRQAERVFTLGDITVNVLGQNRTIQRIEPIDNDNCRIYFEGGTWLNFNDIRVAGDEPAAVPVQEGRRAANVVRNDNFFENLQTRILAANPRALRLRSTMRNRGNQTLQGFMKRFFETYNKERETIYVDDESRQCDTNGGSGRRRSIGDLFMIARYYFPNTTLRQLYDILFNQLDAELPGFRSSYCTTINKYVFYHAANSRNEHLNLGHQAEWGHTQEQIKSEI